MRHEIRLTRGLERICIDHFFPNESDTRGLLGPSTVQCMWSTTTISTAIGRRTFLGANRGKRVSLYSMNGVRW